MWPQAPDPQFSRRTLWRILVVLLSVFAIFVAWQLAMWWGLMIPFFWGVAICMSMRSGMDQASPEAWNRRTSRVISFAVQVFLILILFAPALVLLAVAKIPAALAWVWIILLGFILAQDLYSRVRGPLRDHP